MLVDYAGSTPFLCDVYLLVILVKTWNLTCKLTSSRVHGVSRKLCTLLHKNTTAHVLFTVAT